MACTEPQCLYKAALYLYLIKSEDFIKQITASCRFQYTALLSYEMALKAAGYGIAKHLSKQTYVMASYACLYVNS
jgi:hypothetical protein